MDYLKLPKWTVQQFFKVNIDGLNDESEQSQNSKAQKNDRYYAEIIQSNR